MADPGYITRLSILRFWYCEVIKFAQNYACEVMDFPILCYYNVERQCSTIISKLHIAPAFVAKCATEPKGETRILVLAEQGNQVQVLNTFSSMPNRNGRL